MHGICSDQSCWSFNIHIKIYMEARVSFVTLLFCVLQLMFLRWENIENRVIAVPAQAPGRDQPLYGH